MKDITIKLRPDQAEALAHFLGEHYVANLPEGAAVLIYCLHRGLLARSVAQELGTIDATKLGDRVVPL